MTVLVFVMPLLVQAGQVYTWTNSDEDFMFHEPNNWNPAWINKVGGDTTSGSDLRVTATGLIIESPPVGDPDHVVAGYLRNASSDNSIAEITHRSGDSEFFQVKVSYEDGAVGTLNVEGGHMSILNYLTVASSGTTSTAYINITGGTLEADRMTVAEKQAVGTVTVGGTGTLIINNLISLAKGDGKDMGLTMAAYKSASEVPTEIIPCSPPGPTSGSSTGWATFVVDGSQATITVPRVTVGPRSKLVFNLDGANGVGTGIQLSRANGGSGMCWFMVDDDPNATQLEVNFKDKPAEGTYTLITAPSGGDIVDNSDSCGVGGKLLSDDQVAQGWSYSIVTVGSNKELQVTFTKPTSCAAAIAAGFQLDGDISGDCKVDLLDFGLFTQYGDMSNPDFMKIATDWLLCNDPTMTECDWYWE